MEAFVPPWLELQLKPFALKKAHASIGRDRRDLLQKLNGIRTGDVLPMIEHARSRMDVLMHRESERNLLLDELRLLGMGEAMQQSLVQIHGERAPLVNLRFDSWKKYRRIMKWIKDLPQEERLHCLETEKCRLIEFGIARPYVRQLYRKDVKKAFALADMASQTGARLEPMSLEKMSSDFVTAMLYEQLDGDREIMDELELNQTIPLRPNPAS